MQKFVKKWNSIVHYSCYYKCKESGDNLFLWGNWKNIRQYNNLLLNVQNPFLNKSSLTCSFDGLFTIGVQALFCVFNFIVWNFSSVVVFSFRMAVVLPKILLSFSVIGRRVCNFIVFFFVCEAMLAQDQCNGLYCSNLKQIKYKNIGQFETLSINKKTFK